MTSTYYLKTAPNSTAKISNLVYSSKFLLTFLLLPLIEPEYIAIRVTILHRTMVIWSMFSFALAVVIYFENLRRRNILNYLLLYFLYCFIVSIDSMGGLVWHARFTDIVQIATLAIYINSASRYKSNINVIDILKWILVSYFIINFITVLLLPNGLFYFESEYGSITPYWFLGHKNFHIRHGLTALFFCCYSDYVRNQKLSNFTIIFFLVVFADVFIVQSATGIVCILMWLLGFLFFFKIKRTRHINKFILPILFAIFTSIFFLMVFFDIQRYFGFFIEGFLDRDLDFTSRTMIWERTLFYINQNLLFGQGYLPTSQIESQLSVSHPHSYYLYILYSSGMFGFCWILFIIYKFSKKINSWHNYNLRALFVIFFLCAFTMGFSESLTNLLFMYPLLTIEEPFGEERL